MYTISAIFIVREDIGDTIMHILDFERCIDKVNRTLPVEKGCIYRGIMYTEQFLCDPLEFCMSINSRTGELITTKETILKINCEEQAICAIAHEAGHFVHKDYRTYNTTNNEGRFYMEVRADMFARETCIKLGLDLNKCASLYDMLYEGNICYPLIHERKAIITEGHTPKYRGH